MCLRTPRSTLTGALFPDMTLVRSDEEGLQPLLRRRVDQREGHGVTRLVVGLGLLVRLAAVARGMHVGGTAGEQQAVERVQQVAHLLALRHGRDADRRDRKSTRLNSSPECASRMPSSA